MAFSSSPLHAPKRRRLLYMGALFALFIAGGVGAIALRLSESANAGFDRLVQSNAIIAAADRLLFTLSNLESEQRGYLLTQQETYLLSYKRDYAAVNQRLVELKELTGTETHNRARLNELAVLIDENLSEIDESINLARNRGFAAAAELVGTNQGKNTMDAIREVIGFLQRDEHQRFVARQTASKDLIARYQAGTLSVIIIEIALIASVIFLIARRLEELESLITVCAWTKRVKHKGKWVSFESFLEDRYHLRFTHGISEEALRWQMEESSGDRKK